MTLTGLGSVCVCLVSVEAGVRQCDVSVNVL